LAGVGALSLIVAVIHWAFEEVHYFNGNKSVSEAVVGAPHPQAMVPEPAVQEGT